MQLTEFKSIYDSFEQARLAAKVNVKVWTAVQQTILQEIVKCLGQHSALQEFLRAKNGRAAYIEEAGTPKARFYSSFSELIGAEFRVAKKAEFSKDRRGPMPEINFLSEEGHQFDTRPIHAICATVSRFCDVLIRNLEISDDAPKDLKAIKIPDEQAAELTNQIGAMLTNIKNSLITALAEQEAQTAVEPMPKEQPLTLEDSSSGDLSSRLKRHASVHDAKTVRKRGPRKAAARR